MIAVSTPLREGSFPSRLATLTRSASDLNLQNSKPPITSPPALTPRSFALIRSGGRAKLSRSMSLEGETTFSARDMKFLRNSDELRDLTVPEDSADDDTSNARTNTSTGSLCFKIPEKTPIFAPGTATALSAQTPSIKGLVEECDVPKNFSMVWPGVYRSSFPAEANFPYLKPLKLKTILTLIPEKYPQTNVEFMRLNGIQHVQIGIAANKEPFVEVPLDKITQAVSVILDKRNHPILIHCNKGKHRTGCIVGCLRKIQKWTLSNVFDEYRRFSHPKERVLDEQVIELWEESQLLSMARDNEWVC
ncbi:hypothetical protein DRE_04860 [Drechslerella stenobrocha 248]|uniref:diphosphoinositol-polyphosphate diphosphatase n=1 Tax=Drechslerella stenobrocha 248 TaxID=1043628 RepID=W7I0U7_9PEZI|nr:hypothetical protein DRE_04860 [Drechslerella stenobrocha 248]